MRNKIKTIISNLLPNPKIKDGFLIENMPYASPQTLETEKETKKENGLAIAFMTQSCPHVFEAKPQMKEIYDELWNEYDKNHGQPLDPIRVLQFMYLLDIANSLPKGD